MGEDANVGTMERRLTRYSEIAYEWGSRPATIHLLRALAQRGAPLRESACFVLFQRHIGQADCAESMAADMKEPAEVRARVSQALVEWRRQREVLLQSLDDPAQSTYFDCDTDSQTRLWEEYRAIALSTDVEFRKRACVALWRYFPRDVPRECDAASGSGRRRR